MAKADELISKLKDIKKSENSLSQKRKKATAGAALIGGAGGALVAINRNYNILTYILLGAVIGGMAAHLFLPKEQEDGEDD